MDRVAIKRLREFRDKLYSAWADQAQDVKVNGARHPGLLEPMEGMLRDRLGQFDAMLAALSVEPEPPAGMPGEGSFKLGDRVTKRNGSSWQGLVVGFYSTALTPIGYAVESEREPGSVQIYPEKALIAASPPESAESERVRVLEEALIEQCVAIVKSEQRYEGSDFPVCNSIIQQIRALALNSDANAGGAA